MLFSNIFTKQFLFNPTPSTESSFFVPLLVFFSILILAGAAISLLVPAKFKFAFGRYVPAFITSGVLGIIHVFARHEGLPWLASRFFLGLVLLAFIVWVILIIVWTVRNLPKQIKQKATEERFNKYLPGKAKS